jgi:hypothetical protein
MQRFWLIVIAVLSPVAVQAASMNKCVDASGHVTFTQQACPGGSGGEVIEVKSASKGMLIGDPSFNPPIAAPSRRSYNHCGDLTQVDIRHLIGNTSIQVGMTSEDVIEAWRRPDRINRSSAGNDQWVYDRENYRTQYVYVDGSGCVTAWN